MKVAIIIFCTITILSFSGCTSGNTKSELDTESMEVQDIATPEQGLGIIVDTSEETELPESSEATDIEGDEAIEEEEVYIPKAPDDSLINEAISAAQYYRELLIEPTDNFTSGVFLNSSQVQAIQQKLGSGGYVAMDYERKNALTNTDAVYSFFSDLNDGKDCSLAIFEVSHDGGFLLRNFESVDGNNTLSLIRISWTEGEPDISIARTFEITHFSLNSGDCIVYDYDYPDNPEGGNHDGHVDTLERIELNPVS